MRRWLFADLNSSLLEVVRTLERIEQNSSSTLELSKSTLGAIYNVQQVNREILLELREHRPILERIDNGVQANTEGLMHVLDELRGGPGTTPAT